MMSSLGGGGTVVEMSNRESSVIGGVIVATVGVATMGISTVAGVGVAACVGVDGVAAKERFALEVGVLVTFAAGVRATVVRKVET